MRYIYYTSDDNKGSDDIDYVMQLLNAAMENMSGLIMGVGSFRSSMTFKQMNKEICSRKKRRYLMVP